MSHEEQIRKKGKDFMSVLTLAFEPMHIIKDKK